MYTGVILCVVESRPEMILKITNDNTTLQEKVYGRRWYGEIKKK